MRRMIPLAVIAVIVLSACGSSGGVSEDDTVATKVQEVMEATREAETSIQTAVADVLTATATAESAITPTVTLAPTTEPTPTSSSTPNVIPPTATSSPTPTAQATMTPTVVPAADRYAADGYVPFQRPEIDMMIHPDLSFDGEDSTSDGEMSLYRFADFNAEYLVFDIRVYKELSGGGRISHELAHSVLSSIIENTDSLANLTFVATDDTSIRDRHGVIVRHEFTIDGDPGYGVFMLVDFGTWVYAFDVYGLDYEYQRVEDLLHAIFETAYLRGPQEQATGSWTGNVQGLVA